MALSKKRRSTWYNCGFCGGGWRTRPPLFAAAFVTSAAFWAPAALAVHLTAGKELAEVSEAGDAHHGESHSDFRLLVLQRSRYVNLMSRLVANTMSWMKLLGPRDRVVTVVAKRGPRPDYGEVFPPELGLFEADCADSHNLICVSAELQRKALPLMHDFDGAFFVDDDVYLYPPNLKKAMQDHIRDAEIKGQTQLLGFGLFGCALPASDQTPWEKVHGFCGGSGFGLSQAAALKLLQTPLQGLPIDAGNPRALAGGLRPHRRQTPISEADGYVNSFLQLGQEMIQKHQVMGDEENPRDDVLMGSLWTRAGVNVVRLRGLYGWQVPSDELEKFIGSCSPRPILFHYADDEVKAKIHVEMSDYNDTRCDSSLLQLSEGVDVGPADATATAYEAMLAAYIAANGNMRPRPALSWEE